MMEYHQIRSGLINDLWELQKAYKAEIGEDGNLLNESFDKSLIKLCDVGFLTDDEVLQCLDAVYSPFP